MDLMSVSDYLGKKNIQWKRKGDEALCNCPFCGDKERKMSINLVTGYWQCFHMNKCGEKGNFYEFQKKLGDTPISNRKTDVFVTAPKKKAYVKPAVKIEPPTDPVIKFLHERGLTDETIKFFKVGSEKGMAVSFPYYRGEELVSVKYRGIKEKKFWGITDTEPILYNRDNITSDSLTITEGEIDAMSLHQYGIDAVSVPTGAGGMSWVENEWEYLESFPSIFLCLDSDQAGQHGARDLAIRLGEWRCRLVTLPHKDANKCLTEGVSRETITQCFAQAADFSPDTLVSPTFFRTKIQELFRRGKEMFGTKTPWTLVDKILKGWRDSELTIWSGRNGSGKSTMLNQVWLDLTEKKIRSCIYSGEMAPARYLRWAVIQHTENDAPHPAGVDAALDWMSEYAYILNITSGIEPDKLLSDFEFAARRYGVKHFFVDSLMKIHFSGKDEYRDQHDFINRLVAFLQKHNVHVHLVAHPRKGESDDDKPGKVDVKGTSHITDLADNVIMLQRYSEESKATTLRKDSTLKKEDIADALFCIKKNREFGVEGNVKMTFDERTKKFTELHDREKVAGEEEESVQQYRPKNAVKGTGFFGQKKPPYSK